MLLIIETARKEVMIKVLTLHNTCKRSTGTPCLPAHSRRKVSEIPRVPFMSAVAFGNSHSQDVDLQYVNS